MDFSPRITAGSPTKNSTGRFERVHAPLFQRRDLSGQRLPWSLPLAWNLPRSIRSTLRGHKPVVPAGVVNVARFLAEKSNSPLDSNSASGIFGHHQSAGELAGSSPAAAPPRIPGLESRLANMLHEMQSMAMNDRRRFTPDERNLAGAQGRSTLPLGNDSGPSTFPAGRDDKRRPGDAGSPGSPRPAPEFARLDRDRFAAEGKSTLQNVVSQFLSPRTPGSGPIWPGADPALRRWAQQMRGGSTASFSPASSMRRTDSLPTEHLARSRSGPTEPAWRSTDPRQDDVAHWPVGESTLRKSPRIPDVVEIPSDNRRPILAPPASSAAHGDEGLIGLLREAVDRLTKIQTEGIPLKNARALWHEAAFTEVSQSP